MIKTQSSETYLIKGSTEMKIIERSWGIERCYVTPDGEKVCTPAAFSTNHRKLDWSSCAYERLFYAKRFNNYLS